MANTVEYYLFKGFDHKAAEYFAGGKKKIVGVVANRDFTLTISFDNGRKTALRYATASQKRYRF